MDLLDELMATNSKAIEQEPAKRVDYYELFSKEMKLVPLVAIILATLPLSAWPEDEETFTSREYKTLPRFGIPNEFFTDHYYFPAAYLAHFEVKDQKARLSHSELLSAAFLMIAADHVTTEKYHQSYGVSMGSSLMVLLANNFPGLKAVEPSHDVNKGELPIRDLGAFFRKDKSRVDLRAIPASDKHEGQMRKVVFAKVQERLSTALLLRPCH